MGHFVGVGGWLSQVDGLRFNSLVYRVDWAEGFRDQASRIGPIILEAILLTNERDDADLHKVSPTDSNLNNMNKVLHKAKGKAKANEHVPPVSFNLILDSSSESKPSEKAKDEDGVLRRKPHKKRKQKPLECVDFVKEYLTWWQKKKVLKREVEDKTKNLVKEGANSQAMTNSTILINMPKIIKTMSMML